MTKPPPPRAVLRSFRERKLLFDEPSQAIYELDDLTAFVWQSFQSGISLEAAAKELIAAGVREDEAERALAQADLQLLTILEHVPNSAPEEAAVPAPAVEDIGYDELTSLVIELPEVAIVELRLSEDLLAKVAAVLGYLQTASRKSDFRIIAATSGQKIKINSPGEATWYCEPAEFVASLKAEILAQVLRVANYEVALHAAALIRDGRAILLSGHPGAGKSTLALALIRAGWELASDDVVLMGSDGSVSGLAFPVTAKASSWSLIDEHWPDVAGRPSYRRPDGLDVRYIIPERIAAPNLFRIEAFISLDRRADAIETIEDLEPATMLELLLAEANSHDQRLTLSGFNALATALEKPRCMKLTYCDLSDAVTALNRSFA